MPSSEPSQHTVYCAASTSLLLRVIELRHRLGQLRSVSGVLTGFEPREAEHAEEPRSIEVKIKL